MIDNDIIFRINDKTLFSKDAELIHAILIQEYDWLPCATPIMVDRKVLDSKDIKPAHGIAGHILFPAKAYANGSHTTFTIPKELLTPSGMRSIVETHRTLNINKFRITKLGKVREFVREFGGVTFVVEKKGAKIELVDVLRAISMTYKHSSLFSYIYNERVYSKDASDSMAAVISFFDLKYCVPLFNLKKVDGMAISLRHVLQKASEKSNKLIKALDVDLVVSNYEDNLFVIDGVQVNPIEPIKSSIYKNIKNWLAKDPQIKDKTKLTSKQLKLEQMEEAINIELEPANTFGSHNDGSATITSNGLSGDTVYYNTTS